MEYTMAIVQAYTNTIRVNLRDAAEQQRYFGEFI